MENICKDRPAEVTDTDFFDFGHQTRRDGNLIIVRIIRYIGEDWARMFVTVDVMRKNGGDDLRKASLI